jgi:glycosyltransferase involved in cell wall biosynthesis
MARIISNDSLKISVITPSYNSGEFIERAINSVLKQDYGNWEHIIIDGGSTDNTMEILEKYSHLDWVSERDNGQAHAMNKGFSRSKGGIIVYLNGDDYFFPGSFSTVIEEFKRGAKVVVGNVMVKSSRLKSTFLNTPRITLEGMLRHWEANAFCHNPVGYFYSREVQQSCPFNAQNYATMDLEFLLDAASKYSFSKVELTLGCFEDGLNTKTAATHSALAYWKPSTFPYIRRHLEGLCFEERLRYEKDRRDGYSLMQGHMNRLYGKSFEFIPKERLPLISVIIPTYNCEEYICRAIDSVLSQKLTTVEIIVVDDASVDGTIGTLDQKYTNNSQIKIIIQDSNQKLGAARNRGLDAARGKYIFFLDSDDWLNNGCLLHLASIAETYSAEIVACGVDKVWENGRREWYHSYALSCDDGTEALNYLADYKIGTIVWNKLYLREFLEQNKLRFIVPYWHEDVMFTMQAVYSCRNYISINDCYYNYFQTQDSIVSMRQTRLHLESYIKLYIDVVDFLERADIGRDEIGEDLCRRLLKAHCSDQIYPQLIRYADTHTKDKWENDVWLACTNLLGSYGRGVADFLIRAVENEGKRFAQGRESKYRKVGVKGIMKYYFDVFPNSRLRQPMIRLYYAIKGTKLSR